MFRKSSVNRILQDKNSRKTEAFKIQFQVKFIMIVSLSLVNLDAILENSKIKRVLHSIFQNGLL